MSDEKETKVTPKKRASRKPRKKSVKTQTVKKLEPLTSLYGYHDFLERAKLEEDFRVPQRTNKKQNSKEMLMLANSMAAADLIEPGHEGAFAEELIHWPSEAVSSMRRTVERAMGIKNNLGHVPTRDLKELGKAHRLRRLKLEEDRVNKTLRKILSMTDPKLEDLAEKKPEAPPAPAPDPMELLDEQFASAKVDFLSAEIRMNSAEKAFDGSGVNKDNLREHTKQWLKAKRKYAMLRAMYGVE